MRRAFATAALFLAGAGFALAQEEAPAFVAQWERAPPQSDGIIVASQAPVDGIVVLCCRPRRSRSLECNVGYETPRNYSYGYFAINQAAYYVLTPESAAEFNARPYRPIQLTYRFRMSETSQGPAAPDYACPVPRVIVTP